MSMNEHEEEGNWLIPGEVLESSVIEILAYVCHMCGYALNKDEKDTIQKLKKEGMIEK